MSLLRVPCILIAGAFCHVACTPPNPPPPRNERASFNWDFATIVPMSYYNGLQKIVLWSVVTAESAAIIASKMSSSPISDHALSTLFIDCEICNFGFKPSFVIAMTLIIVGSLGRWKSYRIMGKQYTYEMSIKKDHKLVTSGPYAFVRHPGYTSLFCVYLGLLVWQAPSGSWVRESGILRTLGGMVWIGSFLAVISYISIALVRRTSLEDEAMKREFGDEWLEWARRVPYKLIPGVY